MKFFVSYAANIVVFFAVVACMACAGTFALLASSWLFNVLMGVINGAR